MAQKKRSSQMKIIDIIIKLNPSMSVGQAAIAYKILKGLGEENASRG